MRREDGTILIIPVGGIEMELLECLGKGIFEVLGKSAILSEPLPSPDFAFDRDRNQYNSTAIIYSLTDAKGIAGFERLPAVLSADLFASGLNYVFGEAGSKAAVISTARLTESFYGRLEDSGVLRKRMLIEAVHELGHTYGMGHCSDPGCVMYFSNGIDDTD